MPSVVGLEAELKAMRLSTREFNLRFQYALEFGIPKWGPDAEQSFKEYRKEKENND